jgi:alpha/beta hydrolase fold
MADRKCSNDSDQDEVLRHRQQMMAQPRVRNASWISPRISQRMRRWRNQCSRAKRRASSPVARASEVGSAHRSALRQDDPAADPLLDRASLDRLSSLYVAGEDRRNPLLSPAVTADLTGLPPMLVQFGRATIPAPRLALALTAQARWACRIVLGAGLDDLAASRRGRSPGKA